MIIRPPWPPFDFPILSIPINTPRVAPITGGLDVTKAITTWDDPADGPLEIGQCKNLQKEPKSEFV